MFTVDRATGERALPIGDARPVHLRLRSDGQLLELPFGKVTVGSSPRCVLRIQKPGVEPVHCLIVHEAERLTVRRWAADTQLNGSPFDDAFLSSGDCLRLGSVELELVANEPAVEWPSVVELGVASDLPPTGEHEPVAEFAKNSDVDGAKLNSGEPSYTKLNLETAASQRRVKVELPPPSPVESEVETEPEPRHEAEPPLTFAEAAAATSIETVEILFRELQSANGIARGRNRKLLAALRRERAGNEKLVKRLGEATVQLADVHRERADWEKSQWEAMQERQQWKEKFETLERQAKESEARFSEASLRIEELERLVEEARTNAAPVEVARVSEAWLPSKQSPVIEPETNGAKDVSNASLHEDKESSEFVANLAPAEFEWSSMSDRKAAAWDEAPGGVTEDHIQSGDSVPATDALDTRSSQLGETEGQNSVWPKPACQPQEFTLQTWRGLASQAKAEGAKEIETNVVLSRPTAEQSAWHESMPGSSAVESDDDISPFAEFSIWKQGAAEEPASSVEPERVVAAESETAPRMWGDRSFDAPTNASAVGDTPLATENPWAKPDAEVSGEVVEPPKPKAEPTSFIERYSHMFADDSASEPSKPVETIRPLCVDLPGSNLRAIGASPNDSKAASSLSGENEESIEQYMAKLMQRVRGESPVNQSTVTSQATPLPKLVPEVKVAKPEPEVTATLQPAENAEPENGDDEEEVKEVAVNWDTIARRAAAAPTTNLSALRELANESARRAISHHQLKKLRRDAVTKVIVSTLAGMTSLWLMLDAPDWRDIQFITACVSLLVAAYWAGEAFRSMLASMRLAAYDGPGTGGAEVAGTTALPIDVESARD